MSRRVQGYLAAVVCGAVLSGVAIYRASPSVEDGTAAAVLLLSALAIVAELLAFLMPRSARGSIAFIPYLALVVIAPTWLVLVSVACVKCLTELAARTRTPGVLFNVAQHVITLAAAVWTYRALGGVPLPTLTDTSLLFATTTVGYAAVMSFVASFVMNMVLVTLLLAFRSESPILSVWREMHLTTIGVDVLAVPLIFVFAWLYAVHGAIAAATLWVPILGLRQVHKTNLELERTNQELLELMVKSIEARDPYTSGHSRRVKHYSMIIARAIGLSGQDVERIGRAALLHDVGKIYEKYAPILRKTERLNAQEWTTMKEHPIDGANLVATMSGLKDVVPAVRHHHENWDGTGYPDGLAGELIPLPSRIITFADTIDAMTSERPYRKPMSEEQVRAEIVKCRGKQFDPQIADQLLSSPVSKALFAPAPEVTGSYRILQVVRGEERGRKVEAIAVNE